MFCIFKSACFTMYFTFCFFFYKKKSILHLISFKTIIDIISYLFFLTKCWKFYILEGLIIYVKNGIIRSIAIHVILKAQSV